MRIVRRITERARQLADFPASGRVVPEIARPEIREILEQPYRIIYRIRPERVEILAVVHGRRADIGPLPESGAV
jgi:toxin ParE1/3/4